MFMTIASTIAMTLQLNPESKSSVSSNPDYSPEQNITVIDNPVDRFETVLLNRTSEEATAECVIRLMKWQDDHSFFSADNKMTIAVDDKMTLAKALCRTTNINITSSDSPAHNMTQKINKISDEVYVNFKRLLVNETIDEVIADCIVNLMKSQEKVDFISDNSDLSVETLNGRSGFAKVACKTINLSFKDIYTTETHEPKEDHVETSTVIKTVTAKVDSIPDEVYEQFKELLLNQSYPEFSARCIVKMMRWQEKIDFISDDTNVTAAALNHRKGLAKVVCNTINFFKVLVVIIGAILLLIVLAIMMILICIWFVSILIGIFND